jgi:L-ascorbate metabolism protein UlaG (beta-lactamase superfamily)
MGKLSLLVASLLCMMAAVAFAQKSFETDVIKSAGEDLKITFIGHGTLMFTYGGKVIHVDPWSELADYSKLPKADLVLITHEHRDHLDPDALSKVRTDKTEVILPETCAQKVKGGMVMHNGDAKTIAGLKIEAVPAYNILHKRDNGQPFHPKGVGNGYVITFGDKRVYVGGDTENIPEMKNLSNIEIAFLSMNLPYTMTPEMVADAARSFKPKILYPYHTGETNVEKLNTLLKDSDGIEIRFRSMK